VHEASVSQSSRFQKASRTILYVYLGTTLDRMEPKPFGSWPDVVVNLSIPNLQCIEIVPGKIGVVKTLAAALSETAHAKQTRPSVNNVWQISMCCK